MLKYLFHFVYANNLPNQILLDFQTLVTHKNVVAAIDLVTPVWSQMLCVRSLFSDFRQKTQVNVFTGEIIYICFANVCSTGE